MNSISENIKNYRLKFNYSNKALSKVTGISRSYLSDLEQGKCDNLNMKKLYSLCAVFNVTPNNLKPEEMYTNSNKDN